MKKANLILSLALTFITTAAISQQGGKPSRHFAEPILTDTSSTMFFPIRYDAELFSGNKLAAWDFYANILVYDLKTDSYRKLFEKDTYIARFETYEHPRFGPILPIKYKTITREWIFMRVKNKDHNRNGRIDEHDPFILFVTTTTGEGLKPLTDETENVVLLDVYEAQGFAMLLIQRDTNNDGSFKSFEKDYYYRKINLDDLSLGRPINIR